MNTPQERRKMLESRYPQWPDCQLHLLFDRIATQFPNRPLILTDTHCWTYAEAARASRAVAAGLVALGVQPGDRVALIMANHPEFVIAKLAIARAGAVAVAINYLLREDELAYVLEQSGSRFVFAMDALRDRDYRPDLAAVLRRVEGLEQVILQGAAGQTGFLNFDALAAMASADDHAALAAHEDPGRADTLSDIVYTSGTTGRPKGVMLTHDMILRAGYSSALTRAFEDGRRVLFALPMYHVFGYVECFVAALFVGGAIIPQAVFDPAAMLELADRHAATDMVCVPVMTHQLLDAAQASGARPARLLAYFNSGGTNVPEVWDDIRAILGPSEIHTAYGMTETTASAVCTRAEDGDGSLLETNGRTKLAGVAGDPALGGLVACYRVVDPVSGGVLPEGADGELQVRGTVVTCGYFRKDEETREAFTADGWLRTGDIGRLLPGGHLRLTGRIKETYRCGGEMVMPREIEDLVSGLPGVQQALAVGVPDPRMGETGCLFIVPDGNGDTELADTIRAHCAAHLARFKVPRHVLFVTAAEIPLTPTGRPQKFILAEMARERLGLPA